MIVTVTVGKASAPAAKRSRVARTRDVNRLNSTAATMTVATRTF
jgi:hypothetical protein